MNKSNINIFMGPAKQKRPSRPMDKTWPEVYTPRFMAAIFSRSSFVKTIFMTVFVRSNECFSSQVHNKNIDPRRPKRPTRLARYIINFAIEPRLTHYNFDHQLPQKPAVGYQLLTSKTRTKKKKKRPHLPAA